MESIACMGPHCLKPHRVPWLGIAVAQPCSRCRCQREISSLRNPPVPLRLRIIRDVRCRLPRVFSREVHYAARPGRRMFSMPRLVGDAMPGQLTHYVVKKHCSRSQTISEASKREQRQSRNNYCVSNGSFCCLLSSGRIRSRSEGTFFSVASPALNNASAADQRPPFSARLSPSRT